MVVAGLFAATAPGCGDSRPPLFPVVGKVTIDGKPAEEGGVVFHNGEKQLVGSIKPDGTYEIMQNREPGAPIGKYKVTVFVTRTPKDAQGNPIGLPQTLSNQKFMNTQTTPFEFEVTESSPSGTYDLAVTK